MLPLSIVENSGFREFMNHMDPSFTMPSRKTIKSTGLPRLKEMVFGKLKMQLEKNQHPNISVDGWTDATARAFNGYIVQGIDDEWNLLTLPVDFRPVTG